MILFLDFDGVLHPVNQVDLFSREEHLARVLRDFPHVEIVISSAWRQDYTLKNIQTFFLTDLTPMATPNCSTYGHPNCPRQDGQIMGFEVGVWG